MTSDLRVALLTAGRDKPYAFGMATALIAKGLSLDIIGGDDLDCSEWHGTPRVRFLNLRGDMREDASLAKEDLTSLDLLCPTSCLRGDCQAKDLHILWNNKFETFDRVPLMLYYKLLGKENSPDRTQREREKRDSNDTLLNRLTLKIQYRLVGSSLCPYGENEVRTHGRIRHFCLSRSLSSHLGSTMPFPTQTSPLTRQDDDSGIAEKDRSNPIFREHCPRIKGSNTWSMHSSKL